MYTNVALADCKLTTINGVPINLISKTPFNAYRQQLRVSREETSRANLGLHELLLAAPLPSLLGLPYRATDLGTSYDCDSHLIIGSWPSPFQYEAILCGRCW